MFAKERFIKNVLKLIIVFHCYVFLQTMKFTVNTKFSICGTRYINKRLGEISWIISRPFSVRISMDLKGSDTRTHHAHGKH